MNKKILLGLGVLAVAALGIAAVLLGPRPRGPSFQEATPFGPISRVETFPGWGGQFWVVYVTGKWKTSDDLFAAQSAAQAAVLVDDEGGWHYVEHSEVQVNGPTIELKMQFLLSDGRRGDYIQVRDSNVKLPGN